MEDKSYENQKYLLERLKLYSYMIGTPDDISFIYNSLEKQKFFSYFFSNHLPKNYNASQLIINNPNDDEIELVKIRKTMLFPLLKTRSKYIEIKDLCERLSEMVKKNTESIKSEKFKINIY